MNRPNDKLCKDEQAMFKFDFLFSTFQEFRIFESTPISTYGTAEWNIKFAFL